MSQSRKMSMAEAVTNTVGGLVLALVAQVLLFYFLEITVSASDNVVIVLVMMAQSLVRQYAFRRFFNWLDRPRHKPPTPESLVLMLSQADAEAPPPEALVRLMQG